MVSGERVISVGINYLLYSAICLNGTVVGLHTNLLKYLCVGAKEREREEIWTSTFLACSISVGWKKKSKRLVFFNSKLFSIFNPFIKN